MRNDDDNSLYNEWKQILYDGLSIIFHRFHSYSVTFIKNNQNDPCHRILGLDCTNWYGATFLQTFPTGLYCRYFSFDKFSRRKVVPYGFEAVNWFHYVMYSENIFIQHKFNGGEKKIDNLFVDRYCSTSQTIYKYHGCYFHGHD